MNLSRTAGLTGAAVLAGIGGLHVHWGLGGSHAAAAAIPTEDGHPTLSPGPAACFAVAGLLGAAATSYAASATGAGPRWLWHTGAAGAAAVLALRAVGDGRHVGFTKTVRGTPFARCDTLLYSPLCAALAAAGAAVATRP